MKLVSDLYNKAASFKKDEKGSIVPITAILIPALFMVAGAALDYTRYSNARTILNSALDAAVLDAGSRLGSGQAVDAKFQEDFNNFFEANIVGRGGVAREYNIVSFTANPATGEVNASGEARVDTTLTKAFGFEEMIAESTSGGIFEATETEISIMLDVTGSMRGSKIRALRSAATDAVNILLPNGNNTRNTRVSLVPYASSVNAHRFASIATRGNRSERLASLGFFASANNNVRTNGCVTGRSGREAATDTSFRDVPVGSDARTVNPLFGALGCPNARVLPLTNNVGELTQEIAGLDAEGATAGHLGIAWSYYTLSPNWNSLWGNQNNSANAYGSDTNKVAILMTDGVFNTAYNTGETGPYDHYTSQAARDQSQTVAAQLCENMKTSGITIYTIAFELEDDTARNLLDNCATDDNNGQVFFYEADNEDELRDAFRNIANNITSLRLTN